MGFSGTNIFLLVSIVCFVQVLSQSQCNTETPDFRSKLSITGNGFEGLVVAIHPRILQDYALIEDIKDIITEGSAALFTATKRRAYIRKATILLPYNWIAPPGAHEIDGDYSYAKSDIVVGPKTPQWDWKPHVIQGHRCESPAPYPIHYTTDYLRNAECANSKFGDRGKTFATLFAKYRWGVFDETPFNDTAHYRWAGMAAGYVPNKCSKGIKGENKPKLPKQSECTDVDKSNGQCTFQPYDTSGREVKASLLYSNRVGQVKVFCDESGEEELAHDNEAENDHNKYCGHRSVMAVIRCSPDFAKDNNPPKNTLRIPPPPEFKVIKWEKSKRISMVLDTSGSMQGERLMKMRRGAIHYLENIVPYQFSVAVIEFGTIATHIAEMTLVDTPQTRASLVNILPTIAPGQSTCIGCGIIAAIEALESGGQSPVGQRILVLTDGAEGSIYPTIADTYETILIKNITVDAIMFTVQDLNHKLAILSEESNGLVCFCPDGQDNDICLGNCFAKTLEERSIDEADKIIGVASESSQLSEGSTVNGSFLLDNSVGGSSEFIFNSKEITNFVIKMFTPSGTTISTGHEWYKEDTSSGRIKIAPNGIAESGEWYYQITNTQPFTSKINLLVRTRGRSNSTLSPVLVKGFLSSKNIDYSASKHLTIYASLTRGDDPVLNANAVAKVQPPDSAETTIVLNDNGTAPDLKEDDGVYSGSFFGFTQTGRYSAVIVVEGKKAQAKVITRNYGSCGDKRRKRDVQANSDHSEITERVPLMPFTRVQQIDFFEATNVPTGPNHDPSALIEPARIVDLTVSQIGDDRKQVTLTWTAVGADLDIGTANIYDIRYSNTTAQLISNVSTSDVISDEHIITGNFTSPLPSGSMETFIVKVPKSFTGDIIIFVVRAIDGYGNIGDVSNLAYGTLNVPKFDEKGALVDPPNGQCRSGFLNRGLTAVAMLERKVTALEKEMSDLSMRTASCCDGGNGGDG